MTVVLLSTACSRDDGPSNRGSTRGVETVVGGLTWAAALAVDSTYLYWLDSVSPDGGGEAARAPTNGGAKEVLAHAKVSRRLLLDDEAIYWAAPEGILRRAKEGAGAPEVVVSSTGTRPLQLGAVDTSALVVIDDGKITRVARDGGARVVLVDDPDAQCDFSELSSDGHALYWVSRMCGGLERADLDGGNRRVLDSIAGDSNVVLTLTPAHVVWGMNGYLNAVAKDTGARTELVNEYGAVSSAIADEARVFFTRTGEETCTVESMPIGGGDRRSLATVCGMCTALAGDPTHVYVGVAKAEGCPTGRIVRIPKE